MDVIRFEIKKEHYARILAIAERVNIDPGILVSQWLSQKIRKWEMALDKKPIGEKNK